MARYAITRLPTPVFNTPHLSHCFGGKDGDTLSLDDQNLMRTVETILFPQTKVEMLEQVAPSIWKIRTDAYNYPGNHYIDDRFVEICEAANRTRSVPPIPTILAQLEKLVGTRYIWGGNWPQGIEHFTHLYPSKTPLRRLPSLIQDTWKFKGVDCTGLFHYVSNGYTERNSSKLVRFGHPVLIEGLGLGEIVSKLHPIDLIVWPGHVVGVFDKKTSIESRLQVGVVKTDLSERLTEIMRERKPINHWNNNQDLSFVIRRWHPDSLKN